MVTLEQQQKMPRGMCYIPSTKPPTVVEPQTPNHDDIDGDFGLDDIDFDDDFGTINNAGGGPASSIHTGQPSGFQRRSTKQHLPPGKLHTGAVDPTALGDDAVDGVANPGAEIPTDFNVAYALFRRIRVKRRKQGEMIALPPPPNRNGRLHGSRSRSRSRSRGRSRSGSVRSDGGDWARRHDRGRRQRGRTRDKGQQQRRQTSPPNGTGIGSSLVTGCVCCARDGDNMKAFDTLIIENAGSKNWMEMINVGRNDYNRTVCINNEPDLQLSIDDVIFHTFSCIQEGRIILAELEAIFRNQIQNQSSSVVIGQTTKGALLYDPVIQKNLRDDTTILLKIMGQNPAKMAFHNASIASSGAGLGVQRKRKGVSCTRTSLH